MQSPNKASSPRKQRSRAQVIDEALHSWFMLTQSLPFPRLCKASLIEQTRPLDRGSVPTSA